jgi:hypothetical protein
MNFRDNTLAKKTKTSRGAPIIEKDGVPVTYKDGVPAIENLICILRNLSMSIVRRGGIILCKPGADSLDEVAG